MNILLSIFQLVSNLTHVRLLISAFLLFSCFNEASAQEKILNLKHYSAEQGLSDNQVTSITRDHNGFMWIGTKDGLNRYDGHEFHIFKHISNDTNSICANSITSLAVDADSILWIGTASSGLASYDFRSGRFKSYNKYRSGFPSNAINTIAYDKFRNRLWIGFNNGGSGYMSLENHKYNTVDSARSCYALLPTGKDIYAGTIARSIYTIIRKTQPDSVRFYSASTINTIYIAKDSSVWVGAWNNALHRLDLELNYKQQYFFDKSEKLNNSGDEIYAINEDPSGTLWIGTKLAGLILFDRSKNSFKDNFRFSIPVTTRVNAIFKDDFNRIWIATMSGLYLYDPTQNQFDITYLPVPKNTITCHIHGKCTTPGGIEIVAGDCGLFYKDKMSSSFTHKEFIYEKSPLQLTEIFQTSDNKIFVGTNKTLFELDTLNMSLIKMNRLVSYETFSFFSIYASTINSIAEFKSSDKSYLIASIYGHILAIVDPDKKDVGLPFKLQSLKKSDYLDNLVRKIYIDSKNRIWLCGVTKGIQQLIPMEVDLQDSLDSQNSIPELKSWVTFTDNKLTTPVNNIFDMLENRDGTFWVTSQGSGLMKFNPESTSGHFTIIPGNYQSLQGINKDNNGNLWIITASGILQYDPDKNRYKRYDRSHGIPNGVSGHFFENDNRSLSAGFNSGYIVFNPDSMLANFEKPKVHITRLWVMDQSSDSLLNQELVLPANKNFVKLYLSANCFSFNDQTTFQYQLEGIDDEWRNNASNPLVSYTSLPPGSYNFRFKATNSDGIESEIAYYQITVVPPFYKTWYFYSLLILISGLSIFGLYKYRIRQILKLQEVRNKIARDLHDDIGSTLGSIHLYSQVAHSKLKGESNEDVTNILEKIASGSREIIDKTSDTVWAVKPENDALSDLYYRMESYAASVLGVAGISFTINCPDHLLNMHLKMDHRKNLFLIFKESLHNTIKYAESSEVHITFSKKDNHLQMKFSDNGKGIVITENKAYNGNGIQNMRKRAEEIGGVFAIQTSDSQGTTITITL
ncbi:MAG: hypothetical protein JNL49_05395 [Bacteroidia bacterium]|nr:hypothetical protein [Bacteroidia bacterium]